MTSTVFWRKSRPNDVIPYSRQFIEEDDIEAVAQVLRSDFLTQGPVTGMFESALASYTGAHYAVLFSSGTAALHAAHFAAGLREGDDVITSPITFAATSNAALYRGARPVFADVEPDTANMDVESLERAITLRAKAIVPVHYGGHPVDLEALSIIAKEFGLVVIEDACHALGAEYRSSGSGVRGSESRRDGEPKGIEGGHNALTPASGCSTPDLTESVQDPGPRPPNPRAGWTKIGSCAYSDMTVFSFHPVKHVATGEGGAVLTNSADYYEKLCLFRTHGMTKDPSKFKIRNPKSGIPATPAGYPQSGSSRSGSWVPKSEGAWYYEMQELGFNYRISDIQAGLGLSQLRKLDRFVSRRREIADCYKAAFANNPWFATPPERSYARSSYHLYPIRLLNGLEKKKSMIFSTLKEAGIGVQVHYIPVYLHPYYQEMGFKQGICPAAEEFYQREMSIPLYQGMDDQTMDTVIKAVKRVVTEV